MKQARNYSSPYNSVSLKEHIASGARTTATCWKLVSEPNSLGTIKTVAATSHTRDITLSGHAGITFLSAQGAAPSAVDTEAGLSSTGVEVDAAFVIDVLSEESIASGDWDNASFEVFIINYNEPKMGELVTFSGNIGEVSTRDNRLKAEGRPLSSKAEQDFGDRYVPNCIARNFGDADCKHPIGTVASPAEAGGDGGVIIVGGTVTTGGSNSQFVDSSRTQGTDYFTYGLVEFTSGVLAGRVSEIQRYVGSSAPSNQKIVSDNTWKQSTTLTSGWQNNGFNDSGWSSAIEQVPSGGMPWGTVTNFPITSQASWIWSSYSLNTNVANTTYFRKTFTPNITSGKITITADSNFRLYINGTEITAGSVSNWETVHTYNITTFNAGSTNTIAVVVVNDSDPSTYNPAGLLFDLVMDSYTPNSSGGTFELAVPMPRIIEAGTTYKAIRGCDRYWETCKNVFNNVLNFRGFPFVPGIEQAYRTREQINS
jgi:uncharacterized phage protein (TIGR02218 family)